MHISLDDLWYVPIDDFSLTSRNRLLLLPENGFHLQLHKPLDHHLNLYIFLSFVLHMIVVFLKIVLWPLRLPAILRYVRLPASDQIHIVSQDSPSALSRFLILHFSSHRIARSRVAIQSVPDNESSFLVGFAPWLFSLWNGSLLRVLAYNYIVPNRSHLRSLFESFHSARFFPHKPKNLHKFSTDDHLHNSSLWIESFGSFHLLPHFQDMLLEALDVTLKAYFLHTLLLHPSILAGMKTGHKRSRPISS